MTIDEVLLSLFFVPGSTYYTGHPYRHTKRSITSEVVREHLQGSLSVAAPSTHGGLAKWVGVDMDCLDIDAVRQAIGILRQDGLPAYVNFSGNKGFHIHVFFAGQVALKQAQAVSASVRQLFERENIPYDKISPSPNGKGGDCMCLPLGVHPATGKHRYLLDTSMEPVENPLEFLTQLEKLDSGNVATCTLSDVDVVTGATNDATYPETLSSKPCINRLWREGLQAPHTRHSATCAIANAVARSPTIPRDEKENALLDWVCRAFELASFKVFTTSGFDYWISEARRLWKLFYSKYNYAELCENQTFRVAMRSACDDELRCRLSQNRGVVDYMLLKRLSIWNAHNAGTPGLGKSCQAVYEALWDICENNRLVQVGEDMVFSTTQQEVCSLSNCSPPTVRKHLSRLIRVGLVKKVPKTALPREYQHSPWTDYALPTLTEELLREVLKHVRGL